MKTCEEVMHKNVRTCADSDTVARAALIMRESDIGFIPVTDSDGKLEGIVTDRDLAIRVLADNKDGDTPLSAIMSQGTLVTVSPKDDISVAERKMTENGIARIAVVDDQSKVVGVISRPEIAESEEPEKAGEVLVAIVEGPGRAGPRVHGDQPSPRDLHRERSAKVSAGSRANQGGTNVEKASAEKRTSKQGPKSQFRDEDKLARERMDAEGPQSPQRAKGEDVEGARAARSGDIESQLDEFGGTGTKSETQQNPSIREQESESNAMKAAPKPDGEHIVSGGMQGKQNSDKGERLQRPQDRGGRR